MVGGFKAQTLRLWQVELGSRNGRKTVFVFRAFSVLLLQVIGPLSVYCIGISLLFNAI